MSWCRFWGIRKNSRTPTYQSTKASSPGGDTARASGRQNLELQSTSRRLAMARCGCLTRSTFVNIVQKSTGTARITLTRVDDSSTFLISLFNLTCWVTDKFSSYSWRVARHFSPRKSKSMNYLLTYMYFIYIFWIKVFNVQIWIFASPCNPRKLTVQVLEVWSKVGFEIFSYFSGFHRVFARI